MDIDILINVAVGFVLMSFAASSVYIINDIKDVEEDKKHKKKKNRPLASGDLLLKQVLAVLISLFVLISLLLFYFQNGILVLVIVSYLIINLVYSFGAKNVPVLEMFLLSSNYWIRLLVGALIGGIAISGWLFTTVFFGTFILISGKRLGELRGSKVRKVLKMYTKEFLNGLLLISIAITIGAFSLYSIEHGYTYIPQLVALTYILIRYYYLSEKSDLIENPELVFIKDKHMLIGSIVFFLTSFVILYS